MEVGSSEVDRERSASQTKIITIWISYAAAAGPVVVERLVRSDYGFGRQILCACRSKFGKKSRAKRPVVVPDVDRGIRVIIGRTVRRRGRHFIFQFSQIFSSKAV